MNEKLKNESLCSILFYKDNKETYRHIISFQDVSKVFWPEYSITDYIMDALSALSLINI